MSTRLLTGFTLAAAVCLLAACPASRQGPPLPDIGDPIDRVDRRTERLDTIHTIMRRDLGRLDDLQQQLSSPPDGLFATPFPTDLFRHVAMRCLNTTSGESAPEQSRPEQSKAEQSETEQNEPGPLQLDCKPRFEQLLHDKLRERTPDRTEPAVDLLGRVDRFQSLRGQLRRRIARIDEITAQTRERLANRRADLSTRREKLKKNRTEYPPGRWRKAIGMLDAYRNALNKLEHATNALDTDSDRWPARLETINEEMYFAISERWGG